jgi:[ribosomal protein S5]-alanine N-acetyltransferase
MIRSKMFFLETERLVLITTPVHVLETRLKQDDFRTELMISSTLRSVHFPPEYPGDALVLFPMMLEQHQADPSRLPWDGTLIAKETWTAVGQMGFKGLPDEEGTIEMGYNVSPSAQGQGFATEMVSELSQWAARQPSVKQVKAECLETNAASIRVLEKSHFKRVGQRFDKDEGGILILWELKK